MEEEKNFKPKPLILVSVLYFGVLIYILFLKRLGYDYGISSFAEYMEWIKKQANIIPFINIYGYVTAPHITLGYTVDFIKNLAGNIAIFVPMGYFLPAFSKKLKSFGKYVLTVLIISLLVEIIQLLTLTGMFDINDLILNTIGGAVGFCIVKKLREIRKSKE